MSQAGIINVSGSSGVVDSVEGTAPITVNGASGTPETGAVTVALTTPLAVDYGGTGAATFTSYSVICSGTTATGEFQNVSGSGTSTQVLTSNGTGTLPTWQSVSAAGAVTTLDGDTGAATASSGVILVSGGSTGLTTSGSGHTLDLTGTLGVGHGGTDTTSFTSYAVICGGTTSTGAFQNVVGSGTSSQVLTSNGVGILPSWQAVAGGSGIATLDGNTGSATGSTVTVTTGSTNANGTAYFSGTSATLTLNSADSNGNVGWGSNVLAANTGNVQNTVSIGVDSLAAYNGNGYQVSIGFHTLSALTGDNTGAAQNTVVGQASANGLINGEANCIFGGTCGDAYSGSESSNIIIGYDISGVNGESNVLRIGKGTGTANGDLNVAYIQGIYGISGAGNAVLCTSSGQLVAPASSIRYKEDIHDMDDFSSGIYDLRPVNFLYKSNPEMGIQPGLIAEEVKEVYPELVVHDREGLPSSVQYHLLPTLLLNEIQKLRKRIEELEKR